MEKIYRSPLVVYLVFALLIGLGAYSYFKLPVALFPNSTKPNIKVRAPFGKLSRDGFISNYGQRLEFDFKSLQLSNCTNEETKGDYSSDSVHYSLKFSWGDDGDVCLKEVNQILASYKSSWPTDVQNQTHSWIDSEGSGFLFLSLSSDRRSGDEVYKIVEPILQPKLTAIREASNPELYDPSAKQISIKLSPMKLASLKILPRDVLTKIQDRLKVYSGGTLNQSGNNIGIEISSNVNVIEDLSKIIISVSPKKNIYLSELAQITYEADAKSNQILKINGSSAVILYLKPAPGKNIKAMADKTIAAIKETLDSPTVPKDIKYFIGVNPAEFVNNSISNVLSEVLLCSLIAVLVLFIFIGSFFGTLTALIEIPTSIVLSFIMMRLTGVELNMVSLGGLALSVGMNVDASIVVIDSIIKRYAARKEKGSILDNAKLVADAVHEVAVPVIVSTITSLIVFIPLVFTSDLSYAILGDLAKAVIYSHGLSMFIAMILVPTIRVHLAEKLGGLSEKHSIPWLDRVLEASYDAYCKSLDYFLDRRGLKYGVYVFVSVATVLVCWLIPPQLKREIIAKPESPIVIAVLSTTSNTDISQMEEVESKFERMVNEKFGSKIDFIFAGVNSPNNAWCAINLKDKKTFPEVLKNLQQMTKDDHDMQVVYWPFNPAELPVPNPKDWKFEFTGPDNEGILETRDNFRIALLEAGIVDDLQEGKSPIFPNKLLLELAEDKLDLLSSSTGGIRVSDISDLVNLATSPMYLGDLIFEQKVKRVYAKYQDQLIMNINELTALPIPFGNGVIPLRAIANIQMSKDPVELTRINGQYNFSMGGYFTEKEKEVHETVILEKLKKFLEDYKEKELTGSKYGIQMVDSKVELSKAMNELLLTIAISIGLIFLVLVLQFSSLVHSLIIMLAIPFGILGVFLSLYVFNSTISLNSGLGVILLVGITVANSIMLVEMIIRLVEEGIPVRQAIMETARKRIRPIVMTSLTTILGMLPIAVGHGEGSSVLQPLGIAVCGGLWISLVFTLYIIPSLELSFLEKNKS